MLLPLNRRRETRGAYTLIELMLAIGLGTVVAYTAAAALRAADQAVTASNRLGRQNAMIRAGMLQAFDELDYWTTYDDPADPANQRLRAWQDLTLAPSGVPRRLGLPFSPLKQVWPAVADSDPELARGWDTGYAWPSADPRTWWRGNMCERVDSDLRHGRYGIFANTLASTDQPSPFGPYGSMAPAHTWLDNQMRGLMNALGFYGLCEYLPANELYAIVSSDPADGPTTAGGIPHEWVKPGAYLYNGSGVASNARGLEALSFASSYAINPVTATTVGWDVPTLLREHRRHILTATWFTNAGTLQAFIANTEAHRPLGTVMPAHWPKVEVVVCRTLMLRRFMALCRVRWGDAITGESAEITFAGFGTTLRGARQQRGLDAP